MKIGETMTVRTGARALDLDYSRVEQRHRRGLHEVVALCLDLVPAWPRRVRFQTANDDRGSTASTDIHREYLDPIVTLYPTWFELDVEDRVDAIAHELAHLTVADLVRAVDQAVKIVDKSSGKPAASALDAMRCDREEEVVCNIAHAHVLGLIRSGALDKLKGEARTA